MMSKYGSDSSKVISTSGALTAEMIEASHQRCLDQFGKPDPQLIVPHGMIEKLIEWDKQERYWKSLGPLGEKKERLRYRLKHRAKHTVMNLPQ